MKAIKYIVCGVLVVAMSGCKGFFDTNSPFALDASNVFSNPEYTEQAIASVYELMGENNSYRNRIACNHVGLNTDIEYCTMSTGKTSEQELSLYDCGISNDRIANAQGKDIWGYLNTAVERCNNAIEGLEAYADLSDAQMKYYLGEVYFLRSWAYLEMVKYWGDVPARFVSIAADMDGVNAPKTDRNEVFEHLRVDLKKAAEYLAWSADCPAPAKNNVSRPSKAAALALLARADLMYAGMAVRPGTDGFDVSDPDNYTVTYNIKESSTRAAVYQEALEACAEIIKQEDFKLQAEYEKVFRDVCADKLAYNDMEQIWVMPFKDGARGQVMRYNSPKISSDMGSSSADALGPMAEAKALKGYNGASSNSNVVVMPTFYYSFDPADVRRDVTVATYQWYYDKGEGISKTDKNLIANLFPDVPATQARLYQRPCQINTFYLSKYRWEWLEGRSVTYGQDDGVDFPVLRYADVLLMFAEAEIGGIGGDRPANNTGLTGIEQLNKVRRRAHVAELGAVDMDAIMNERAFELCGELIRKWDLMRWGVLRQQLVKTAADMELLARENTRHSTYNIGDTLYYNYKYDAELKAYVIDMQRAWGLHKGETGDNRPTDVFYGRKALFDSDSKGYLITNTAFPIYREEAKLESRQYWPIFSYNITASNGTLWNNYGYK